MGRQVDMSGGRWDVVGEFVLWALVLVVMASVLTRGSPADADDEDTDVAVLADVIVDLQPATSEERAERLARVFDAAADESDLDPRLLVALAMRESSLLASVERGEVRGEREDQRINASLETLKKMGREVGADFMLIGEINQINDREGKEEVRYYQTDLTLINIETNIKAWVGQKKIKKYVARRRYNP